MPPKLRPAHHTLQILPTFAALARTLLTVLDELAAEGLEEDDRPRIYATTLTRWVRDEATPAQLAADACALDAQSWRALPQSELAKPWPRALHAANSLATW